MNWDQLVLVQREQTTIKNARKSPSNGQPLPACYYTGSCTPVHLDPLQIQRIATSRDIHLVIAWVLQIIKEIWAHVPAAIVQSSVKSGITQPQVILVLRVALVPVITAPSMAAMVTLHASILISQQVCPDVLMIHQHSNIIHQNT